MTSKSVKYYRTDDPVENFKIRLTLREISRLQVIDEKGVIKPNSKPLFSKKLVFSWQEKRYSPSELNAYIQHKNNRYVSSGYQTQRLKDVFKNLDNYEKSTKSTAESLIGDIMLYTYVDKDHFAPFIDAITLDASGQPSHMRSYVGASMEGSSISDATIDAKDKRAATVQQRMKRDVGVSKEMYICLATDVDVETLKAGTAVDPSFHFKEHVLCFIRYYENGLLEISLGLSEIIDESANKDIISSIGEHPSIAMAANLSDGTVIHGVKDGFRLKSFRLKSSNGSDFEYAVENLNEVFAPQILDELRSSQMLKDSQAMAMNMGQTDDEGTTWKQDPPPKGFDTTCSFYAELVSGCGFEGDSCFVSYQVLSPQHWHLRTGNLSDGVAEQDFAKEFSNSLSEPKAKDILLNDGFVDGPEALGILQGVTTTVSAGSFQSYGLHLPQSRSRWRGYSVAQVLPMPSRLILSLSFLIVTIFAMILGFDYPLWIVPGLVIFITLYTGMPGALFIQFATISNASKHQRAKGKRGRELIGPFISQEIMHFNHLLNFSFDVKSLPLENLAGQASAPTIVFQVYSLGWFGRYRLEGYGSFTLLDMVGSVDTNIKTWKPKGFLASNMTDHFLGCSPHLQNLSFIDIPDHTITGVNKLGFNTEPSGSLRFRCHTIVTNPKLSDNYKHETNPRESMNDIKLSNSQAIKQQQVRQTVEDILQNYRATTFAGRLSRSVSQSQSSILLQIPTRTSMPGNIFSSTSSLSTSISAPRGISIVDALNANERAERVAQILALAKAKSSKPNPSDNNEDVAVSSSSKSISSYNAGNSSGAENDSLRVNVNQPTSSHEESEPLLYATLGDMNNTSSSPRSDKANAFNSSLQSQLEVPLRVQGKAARSRKGSVRYRLDDEDDEETNFIRGDIDDYPTSY